MEEIEFSGPPLTSRYVDVLPEGTRSPKGGFAIEIKSPKDLLSYAGNLKLINEKRKEFRCTFGFLRQTRLDGQPSAFSLDSFGCPGARFYLGFTPTLPKFNHHFTSTGFPVVYKGERLSPSAGSSERHARLLEGTIPKGRYLLFERFDQLSDSVSPDVVTFFANPEIITALVALVRFVTDEPDSVSSPFTAGCASIFTIPYSFAEHDEKKGVLGIFDPGARSYLYPGELTLSLPFSLFEEMLRSWKKSFIGITGKEKYLMKNAVPGWPDQKKRAEKLERGRKGD